MHAVDWAVIAVYVIGLVAIGWRASRGQATAEGHLRAGRSLPAWAVVFSVLATEISAATYIGVPEIAYKGAWTYLETTLGALLGKVALAYLFIRLYWRLDLPTAYGFLARRVGPRAQKASAWAFLVGRLISSGVRLFIAGLAFAVVTGASLGAAIAAMALVSTVYTFVGGLKAVVWTDVLQGSIFVIGALAALVFGLLQIGRPVGDVLSEAMVAGKLQAVALVPADGETWLTSLRALPVAVLGGFFLVLASHGTDQENVQHLLNVRSERGARRSIVASGLFAFPVVVAFLAVGTMLWSYHRHVGGHAYDPGDTRYIFPNFIMHALPLGLRGLVFAGLFAAAVSSLGATLNANAVFGGLLMAVGLFFAWYSKHETNDLVMIALGAMTIVYGGLLGGFLCGLLYRTRGSDASVTLGMAAGCLLGALLFFHKPLFGLDAKLVEWPFYIPIACAATLLVGALGRREAAT
jgi:Na+/proline symporter